ncbi:MAG: hypothetical protein ABI380_07400 [Edaphobacter sp.]
MNASTTAIGLRAASVKGSIRAQFPDGALSILESLRKDVARHPGDFVIFETQISANQFIRAHEDEAYRETEPRVVMRGILGYWRGKAIVVLPSLSTATTW